MTPGPNTVLISQSAGLYGKKAAFYNTAGVISGLYVHAIVFAVGLSILIVKSSEVYQAIRLVGALYIVFLGVMSLYSTYKTGSKGINGTAGCTDPACLYDREAGIKSFLKGFISMITNPKVALFFLSFFPHFIHSQANVLAQSLFLTMLYSIVSVAWYSLLVFFIHRFRKIVNSDKVQRRIKIVTGVLFVSFGLKLATQK